MISEDIFNFLSEVVDGEWETTENGIVVKGDVYITRSSFKGRDKIPVKFHQVHGLFMCENLNLSTLENSPEYVRGSFSVSGNNLRTLEGGPKKVRQTYYCTHCGLESLKGSPLFVGRHFFCSFNNLTSTHHAPFHIGDTFNCIGNKITSIDPYPNAKFFEYANNPIYFKDIIDEKIHPSKIEEVGLLIQSVIKLT